MNERLEWIEDAARLRAIAAPWQALADSEDHPFADPGWFEAWWGGFGTGRELRTAALWRGDDLRAVLPLARSRGGLEALSNYHSPLFCVPAADDAARAAVLSAALDNSPSRLFLHGVPAGNETERALRASSRSRGRMVTAEGAHVSPIVDIAGDLQSYLAGRGSTLRRRRRKLDRDHDARLRLDDGGTDLDGALSAGFALEAVHWKRDAGTAIVSDPATERFYRDLAAIYRARGELRLGTLAVDGVDVAWHFSLQRGLRLYMLKTGFAEGARKLAPGLLCHLMTVERCFEEGLDAYEMLGGIERYKLELSTDERRHLRLWSHGRGPSGLARAFARRRLVPLAREGRRRLAERRAGGGPCGERRMD